MTYFCERIRSDHDLTKFSCGNASLDRWLRDSALTSDRSGISRSYVLVNETSEVVGYFALAPHSVDRAETHKSIARTAPNHIPGILLAKLALASSCRNQGLGAALLSVALEVALEGISRVGGRVILVDAIDEQAAGFYGHHGFKAIPGNPNRLIIKASSVANSLGIRWP